MPLLETSCAMAVLLNAYLIVLPLASSLRYLVVLEAYKPKLTEHWLSCLDKRCAPLTCHSMFHCVFTWYGPPNCVKRSIGYRVAYLSVVQGVWERDPIRKDDSFRTFEEIFQIAKELQVDLVLLGGDLFHDNKPTRNTLVRAMNIIQEYSFCDDPVRFQILSNEAENFVSG